MGQKVKLQNNKSLNKLTSNGLKNKHIVRKDKIITHKSRSSGEMQSKKFTV